MGTVAGDKSNLPDKLQNDLRRAFVKHWAKRHNLSPDDDQATAIATGWQDAVVEARAGSGKTRTIVGRALFLMDHADLAADEILILAFNTRAAKELRDRFDQFDVAGRPHVMTFHALARRIVNPAEDIIYDDSEGADDAGQRQTGVIDEIIRDFLSTTDNEKRVRDLFRSRFRADEARADQDMLFLSKQSFVDYRIRLPYVTLAGERVKSHGEKLIANTLFLNSVEYHYERAIPDRIEGAVYRPDFSILPEFTGKEHVVIEYFGMVGDRQYDEMVAKKKAFWSHKEASGYRFLSFEPRDLRSADNFADRLLSALKGLGVPLVPIDAEEVWRRIRKGAILDISRALRSFVQQARKRNWDREAARSAISTHHPLDDTERLFLELAVDAFATYLEVLNARGQIDFDELVTRATQSVEGGKVAFRAAGGDAGGNLGRIRAVLIDEFQDFSGQFHRLLSAGRAHMRDPIMFAVGDPWQAINAFAGATTEYFESFTQDYPGAVHHVLATNYRSSQAIVRIGNVVMQERSETPARASSTHLGRVRAFDGTKMPSELSASGGASGLTLDQQAKARLAKAARLTAGEDARVFILSRTSDAVGRIASAMRPHLTKSQLDPARTVFTTVHQSKGLEADVVVLLDGGPSMFPLVHPNWMFNRIFGVSVDSIMRDEQNLLYVALTRASREVWILLPNGERSPYLPPHGVAGLLVEGRWSDAPALSTYGKTRIGVAGYERREELKALGFFYESETKEWCFFASSREESMQLLQQIVPYPAIEATLLDDATGERARFTSTNWPIAR